MGAASSAARMNPIKKLAGLFAIALTLVGARAFGDTFSYSYTFGDGDLVTGTFDGTLNGNLITDISHTTVTVAGYTLPGTVFDESLSGLNYVDGGATASIDGTQNNLLFVNSDYANADFSFTGYFGSITDPATSDNVAQADNPSIFGNIADVPQNSSWSVTVTSVPDGGMTLAMLGAALLVLACVRGQRPRSGNR